MPISTNTIIYISTVIGALSVIGGVFTLIFKIRDWVKKQDEQDAKIAKINDEQCLLTFGVLACLKGLQEKGCNGPVTEAINKIEKHINQQAHK